MQSVYSLVFKRFAGHSKWANIRHIKGQKDAEKAKAFTKLSAQIKVAIVEGGSPDPNLNIKLSQIIEQAKRLNMPAASIQNVIKSNDKDKGQSKSYLLGVKGPGSSILLCEVFTPNLKTLKNQLGTILRKNNGKLIDSTVKGIFEYRGVIDTDIPADGNKEEILEAATTCAIECEADEVEIVEDINCLRFTCDPNHLIKIQKSMETKGYKIVSATAEYLPLKLISLTDTEMDQCLNLLEKLENLEGIVKVYANIE